MDNYEKGALETARNLLELWYRYVDDKFTQLHQQFIDEFSERPNSVDEDIQVTIELEEGETLPFLDACVHVGDSGTKNTVYRKPTHTDQYLNFS